ncbi:MAG TPA: Ig-like domain repeat protein [Thermoanaerobaculia bacterium]
MLVFAALVLVTTTSAFARMEEAPRSFSLAGEVKVLEQIQQKILPKVDVDLLLDQDRAHLKNLQGPEPLRFAVANDVAFTLKNSGTWQTLADGRLWRLRLHSPGAVSHNLGITRFDMPRGAKLWIYDPEHKHVEGPYMTRHRSQHGSLWTPVIEGEDLVVEVFVPKGVRLPNLEIRKANQGYRDFTKTIPGQGTAGACEIDVVCPVGAPWADQIRAVGAYTLNGTATCTGTLLNNTALDGKPYFLSAYHCNVTSANASTVVVYWNYQSPTCGTQGPGSTADNQSGAIFRARWAPTDFLLLELSSMPPPSYNVYYSGWDATATAPPSTVGIHHPWVDVKSISFSSSAPQSSVWGGGLSSSGNHWRVTWSPTDGVTEPGSSGSCIFSTTTKRCIGQLHGGASYCGAPAVDLWDDYGKFSVSWNGGGTSTTRLKDWLDPLNSGVTGMDGDPHVTTLDGIHYDFQGAGEYVALRDTDGVEIQTRSVPVSTTFNPGPDPYDGLATCVSVNSAVAAKVDGHRVTIQPNLNGSPDPSGLQVRVDGVLTTPGTNGLAVGAGRIVESPVGNGYEINFPNGTALYVTPLYWSSQGKWYMNVDVFRNPASGGLDAGEKPRGGSPDVGGLMAPLAPGSWLPAMPNGSSLGSMPGTLNQRYVDLYQTFGAAWRVGAGSLFDYAPGTSTATFTLASWPPENPPCIIPKTPVANPLDPKVAAELCRGISDKILNANCVFDVTVTGEPGFADLFLFTQMIRAGATFTTVDDIKDPTWAGEAVTFTATVTPRGAGNEKLPAGTVQFLIDGKEAGEPVQLDENGQATWTTSDLKAGGEYQVAARYIAEKGGVFLDSISFDETHTVDWK